MQLDNALRQATSTTNEYLSTTQRPCPTQCFGALREDIDAIDLSCPLHSLEDCISELKDIWLDHAVWYHHPHYIAHLNCPIASAAVAGDVMATVINTAVESWDQASSAALIEQKIITWAASTLEWDTHQANGVFTSGGTQSNLQAMLVARNKALGTQGYAALGRLRIFVSEHAHYSISRAASILGLAPDNVVRIPCDQHHAMNPNALRAALELCTSEGGIPMAIAATAGTTDCGAIDPLTELATIADRFGTHFHVDAAYGGTLLVSPTQRHRLRGIERADSVTVDFHKGFFQPVACSAVLFRGGADLRHVSWHADYLNPHDAEELNLADYSLQTTRRFDALKLWMTLRTHGSEPIGQAFDTCCERAREVAELIASHPDLELLATPSLSTVVFRPLDDQLDPQAVKNQLFAHGQAVIATTRIEQQRWLKFTILDPTVPLADVEEILRSMTTNTALIPSS